MAKKSSLKAWVPFDGEPGVEYEEARGYVAVRVRDGDGYKEAGPIRLIGSINSTVRHLLRDMRTKG